MVNPKRGGLRVAIFLACIAACRAFISPLPGSSSMLLRRTVAGSRILRGRSMAQSGAHGAQMQSQPNQAHESTSPSLPVSSPVSSSFVVSALPVLLPLAALLLNVAPVFAEAVQLPPGVVAKPVFEPRGVTQQDLIVFAVCCFPFIWATNEFWRRIAVGEPFGTGKDSVVITDLPDDADARKALSGEDEEGSTTGRRTLTVGAIRVAYLLFAAVGATVVLVGLAAFQLPLTATPPTP